jgi:O-acetyl-ADP-ribose deacetylase (regulator of RNase III)
MGGGGVDGAVHRAAGPRLAAAGAAISPCEPGDALATPGFDLAARHVIHTVGPVWEGGDEGEAEVVAFDEAAESLLTAELSAVNQED